MAETDQDSLLGSTIGERLKAAREAKGMSLDDVARHTRIPTRHLEHIERGDWESLPATTYSIGFARSYANTVGLDGPAIGAELREQLGLGSRGTAAPAAYYEPADPSRVPPRSVALIAAALALLLVVGYLIWRSNAVDDSGVDESQIVDAPASTAGPGPAGVPAGAAVPTSGPVVLAATADVWMRISDAEGGAILFERTLKAGESFQVPATARAPQIRTGLPEALRVTVGGAAVPPLGAPATTIANVSLRAADLAARAQPGNATAAPDPVSAPPE